jgi:hypothetical protein
MDSDLNIHNINFVRPLNHSPRRKQTKRDDESFADAFEHQDDDDDEQHPTNRRPSTPGDTPSEPEAGPPPRRVHDDDDPTGELIDIEA